jgi:hypothetical protein
MRACLRAYFEDCMIAYLEACFIACLKACSRELPWSKPGLREPCFRRSGGFHWKLLADGKL